MKREAAGVDRCSEVVVVENNYKKDWRILFNMETIKILLLAVFLLQIFIMYLMLRNSQLYKKEVDKWKEEENERLKGHDKAEANYQKERAASLAEYQKCLEEWEKQSKEHEEEYKKEVEEDRKKREEFWTEYEKDKKEWNMIKDRLEKLLEKFEQR